MRERVDSVEKLFLSVLNHLLKPSDIVLSLGDLRRSYNAYPVLATKDKKVKNLGIFWPEWSHTYVVIIGSRRGQYVNWIQEGEVSRINIKVECYETGPYMDFETAIEDENFIKLAQDILLDFSK